MNPFDKYMQAGRSGRPEWYLRMVFLMVCVAGVPSIARSHGGVADVEIVSLQEVTEFGEFPFFSELRYHVLEENNKASVDGQPYLFLRRFQTFGEIDPDDDDVVYLRLLAEYDYRGSQSSRVRESGVVSFILADSQEGGIHEGITAQGSNVVGFIRTGQALSSMPTEPGGTYFGGTQGTASWETVETSREAELSLIRDPDGAAEVLEQTFTLGLAGNAPVFNAISFPVADSDETEWNFGSLFFREYSQDTYYVWTQLTGFQSDDFQEELNDLGVDFDAFDFWNTVYLLVTRDSSDEDRDGLPDLVDLFGSFEPAPWYADFTMSGGWHYAEWNDTWIYADRLSDWDFFLTFGWVFVPFSSDRDSFWHYSVIPELGGWIWTSEDYYPTYYRYSDDAYLRLNAVTETALEFFNYETGSVEVINK